jgi:catechol 2,3-dioxygenase-like lactoylglutathione lyase family enzyme
MDQPNRPTLTWVAPFFIVRELAQSVAFYRDKLGFEVMFAAPEGEPFFAIVERDGVRIFLKEILPEIHPVPNHTRHPWAAWDAHIHTPDPDALAAEFTARAVTMSLPLGDTDDRLRGFAIQDPNGYALFFGRPQ